jgi:hypothetical protein
VIPDWPRLIYSQPRDAYRTLRELLTWLERTSRLLPGGDQCVVCTLTDPGRECGLCRSCYRKTARLEDYLYLTAEGIHQTEALARVSRPGRRITSRTIDRSLANLRKLTGGRLAGVPPQLLAPDLAGLGPDLRDQLARLAWLAAGFDVAGFPQTGEEAVLTARQVADAAGTTAGQVRGHISAGQLQATRYRGRAQVTLSAAAVYARCAWLAADVTGQAAA